LHLRFFAAAVVFLNAVIAAVDSNSKSRSYSFPPRLHVTTTTATLHCVLYPSQNQPKDIFPLAATDHAVILVKVDSNF